MRTMPYQLLALSLFIAACSRDAPVGPSVPTTPQPSATAVIGPSGGTLACEGFSLVIPASTLSRPESLTVTKESYAGYFGPCNVANQFRLNGLPRGFSGKIQLALKCTRTPSSNLVLAVGTEGVALQSGESRILYDVIPATFDSGYVKALLSSDSLTGFLRKTSGPRDDIRGTADFFNAFDATVTLNSDQGHFHFICPLSTTGMADQLARHLEDAYTWFDQAGFNDQTYGKVKWPVTVRIAWAADFKEDVLVESSVIWPELSEPRLLTFSLGCNEHHWEVGAGPEFRKWLFACFAELFAAVHDDLFRDRLYATRLTAAASRIWPYYAIGAWAGAQSHLAGSDSLPPRFAGRKLTPLWGISPPPGSKPAYHGRGWVGLMKHIADMYGERKLVDLFHAVRSPATTNAVDMLFTNLPVAENVWYPRFIRSYLLGEIYQVPADTFLLDLQNGIGSREFTISGKNDTLKYFSADYRDLSARIYKVNLRYPDISSDAMISFEVGPPTLNLNYVHVMVFGYKNHRFEYWEQANKVNVAKLKDLTAAGYDIVAAVVNSANERPYSASMAIDLDVRVQTQVLTRACITVRTAGEVQWYDGRVNPTSFSVYNFNMKFREGTFTNGHFTTSWNDVTTETNTGTWDIVADLSSSPPMVTYFKAVESRVSVDETGPWGTETQRWRIEASSTCAIPGGKYQTGSYVFRVQGQDAGKHILPVFSRLDNPDISYWWELVKTSFDSDSYIEIIIQ